MTVQTATRRMQAAEPAPAPQLPARSAAPPTVPAQAPAPNAYPRALAGALMAIRREISPVAKEGENTFHKYKYVKSEDVIDEVQPLLAKHGVMIIQSEVSRTLVNNEAILAITYDYTVINADGEVWPDRPMRTGLALARDQKGIVDDKASNKASTQSEKYFLIKFFGIRTSDAAQNDNDAGPEAPTPPTTPPPAPPADDEPPTPPEAPVEPPTPPNDPPAVGASAELDGIPDFLRRQEELDPSNFDEAQWIRDLDGALEGAEDHDQLRKVQSTVQLPARELVSRAAWEKGKALVLARSAALLEAIEEPPDA